MKDSLSKHELTVLGAFEGNTRLQLSGNEISEKTRMGSGRLYPTLLSLENRRCLTSIWGESAIEGGPRPRLYSLTGEGHGKHADQSNTRGFRGSLLPQRS